MLTGGEGPGLKALERFPLIIGVVGHRDLREEDIGRLRQLLNDAIREIKQKYLSRDDETPIIFLSSLAEGADRLAARAALDHGAYLIAPLPMPVDEYRRDFDPGLKQGAAEEFEELLKKAIATPIMPFVDGNTLQDVRNDKTKRDLQYREAGLFTIRYCHVLIVLGDRENTKDPAVGGTAQIVKYRRWGVSVEEARSARDSLDGSEIGPLIYIVTPRTKSDSAATEVSIDTQASGPIGRPRKPFVSHWVSRLRHLISDFCSKLIRPSSPEPCADQEPTADEKSSSDSDRFSWEAFSALIDLTRRFNSEAAKFVKKPDQSERLDRSLAQLFEYPKDNACDVSARAYASQSAGRWCALYAIADNLAQDRQTAFRCDWKALFTLGLSALVVFEFATHVLHLGRTGMLLLGFYCLLVITILILLAYAWLHKHQERYLYYRALAEALRVGIFWTLAGIRGPGTGNLSVADAYPLKQPSETAWVKTCLRSLELLELAGLAGNPAQSSPAPAPSDQQRHGWVKHLWVRGQYTYFCREGRKLHGKMETAEARSQLLFFLSLLTAACLFVYWWLSRDTCHDECWDHWTPKFYIVLMVAVLLGLAGVIAGLAEQLAVKALAGRYDRMRLLFLRAGNALPQQIQPRWADRTRDLYAELGTEAIREGAEWVATYLQRPIKPPQG